MSIFKAKRWWSNRRLQYIESSEGEQNSNCLKVDKFSSHSDSDCVLVGDGTLLKIYKPEENEEHDEEQIKEEIRSLLLESDLNEIILQVETGKFIAGSEDRQILVLHPDSYSIYQLWRKEGFAEAGDQNMLKPVLKHSFMRRSHSVTCGPFGNIKTRDFICVQALDGTLSFFDQDTFLFMYIFGDVIIPGPVTYIASSDSFVICKSTWVLEIHSYQQLREFSEMNTAQTKKNIPQWVYNAGEEVSAIQVIRTSSNFSSIIAMGERHLCCFQDNGLMKYMLKFDFMPMCFCAYLIGWYYEPAARLLVMVASDDCKLYIYEATTLLWSCDLVHTAISISRCFLKSLPGGIVTLSTNGEVHVSYLGTEPDLNNNATPMINDTSTPKQVQEELDKVEELLQKTLDGKDGAENGYPLIDQIVKIKADVGKPVQNLFQQFTQGDNDEALHLLMCPIVVMLTCEDPKQIQTIQITYVCCPPFAISDSTLCLDSINGTEIIETQLFVSSEADIPETSVKILFTITDSTGKINVLSREILIPLSLYCLPTETITENELKFYVDTNNPCIDFSEIFTDFSKEDLLKHGNSSTITFIQRTTKKTVTFTAYSEHYSIQANDVPEMTSVLQHFIIKLADHFKRNNKDFRLNLKFDDEFTKKIIHTFLKSVEIHAKERTKLINLEKELNVLQRQFTVIQKRLLVQYGSLPPGDCDPLEFLMKDTHSRIIKSVNEIIQCKETVCRAGCTMTAVGHLIIYIFKQNIADNFKVKLIQEMLALSSIYELYQEWEEAVTQSLSYILNNIFQKSEKDKEKLAPVTEQGVLSHINLKRFLKQIKMALDRMFLEARGDDMNQNTHKENKITRIEEFVEVL